MQFLNSFVQVKPFIAKLLEILEKVRHNSLKTFLDEYKIIADNQYGFRPGISKEDAVLDLTQFVAQI